MHGNRAAVEQFDIRDKTLVAAQDAAVGQ